jgi:hypothetical protein
MFSGSSVVLTSDWSAGDSPGNGVSGESPAEPVPQAAARNPTARRQKLSLRAVEVATALMKYIAFRIFCNPLSAFFAEVSCN